MRFSSVMQKIWGVLILCFSGLTTLVALSTLYGDVSVVTFSSMLLHGYITGVVLVLGPMSFIIQSVNPTFSNLVKYADWTVSSVFIPVLFALLTFTVWVSWGVDWSTKMDAFAFAMDIIATTSNVMIGSVLEWLILGLLVGKILEFIGL